MRQSKVVNALFYLKGQIKPEEYSELKSELKEGKYDPDELQFMHNAFMRDKTSRIESHLKTLKNISVLLLVLTVVGAIVAILS